MKGKVVNSVTTIILSVLFYAPLLISQENPEQRLTTFLGGNLVFTQDVRSDKDYVPKEFQIETVLGIKHNEKLYYGIGLNYYYRRLNENGSSDSQNLGLFPFIRFVKPLGEKTSLYLEPRIELTGRDYRGGKLQLDELFYSIAIYSGFQYKLNDHFTLLGRWSRLAYQGQMESGYQIFYFDFAPAWYSFDLNYYF